MQSTPCANNALTHKPVFGLDVFWRALSALFVFEQGFYGIGQGRIGAR
jgi:hypothetical protein